MDEHTDRKAFREKDKKKNNKKGVNTMKKTVKHDAETEGDRNKKRFLDDRK